MTIYIAADHTGILLKTALVTYLAEALGHEIIDMGAYEFSPEDDYPDVVIPCATKVIETPGTLGIVIGGSGQGEAMAANHVPGARCALFYGQAQATGSIDAEGAPSLDGYDIVRLAREHNDANMLSLAARFVTDDDAKEVCRIFVETSFEGKERHVRRIRKFA